MRSYDHAHPKGNKYSESELRQHRDGWYAKVTGNIGVAGRETVVETDKQVYQQLVNVLPWDGSISFIRTNNFAGFSFCRASMTFMNSNTTVRIPPLSSSTPTWRGTGRNCTV